MANTPDGAIWIEDAAKRYGVTRQWLKTQIEQGLLSYIDVKGDRRTYLVEKEVEDYMRPKVKRVSPATNEEQETA